ncbi:MAG: hypothetical protein C4547_00760 [Phycisphaerales bacterium]|nr:MAG: hypothetical protein C4547_00760 [Phycisphaerales bacterium]
MDIVPILVEFAVAWILLMLLLPIASRFGNYTLPQIPRLAWMLAAILGGTTILSAALSTLGGGTAVVVIAGSIVFWVALVKVFQVDFLSGSSAVALRAGVIWLVSGWFAAPLGA